MKPTAERLESIPAIDGGFVVSIPIPATMKAFFEAAHWRAHLDGQIECSHGCGMAALRSPDPKFRAIGTRAARQRWEIDKEHLRAFNGRALEPIQLRFRLDPAVEWERVGKAIGIPAVRLLQAALAHRYSEAIENAALERVSRLRGPASRTIIPMFAAAVG